MKMSSCRVWCLKSSHFELFQFLISELFLILCACVLCGCSSDELLPRPEALSKSGGLKPSATIEFKDETKEVISENVESGKTAEVEIAKSVKLYPEDPKGEPSKDNGSPTDDPLKSQVDNERIRANDEVLRSLEAANIAFNALDSLNIEDTARIQLLLSLQKSAAELKSQIEGTAKIESATIRVSDRMEAELSGSNFEITAITPKEQAVATEGDVEWKWEVKPKSEGRHQLHLTLTAILSIQGKDTRRAIRTFDKFIEIEVTSTQKIVGFFEKAWQWLWAAILVPIVGWFWNKWISKRETQEAKPAG